MSDDSKGSTFLGLTAAPSSRYAVVNIHMFSDDKVVGISL
jgi:hypothetical protein